MYVVICNARHFLVIARLLSIVQPGCLVEMLIPIVVNDSDDAGSQVVVMMMMMVRRFGTGRIEFRRSCGVEGITDAWA